MPRVGSSLYQAVCHKDNNNIPAVTSLETFQIYFHWNIADDNVEENTWAHNTCNYPAFKEFMKIKKMQNWLIIVKSTVLFANA